MYGIFIDNKFRKLETADVDSYLSQETRNEINGDKSKYISGYLQSYKKYIISVTGTDHDEFVIIASEDTFYSSNDFDHLILVLSPLDNLLDDYYKYLEEGQPFCIVFNITINTKAIPSDIKEYVKTLAVEKFEYLISHPDDWDEKLI